MAKKSKQEPCYGGGDSNCEDLRLEAVIVSVGFDDMLDVTLQMNMPHLDTGIVVTNHADRKTHQVARKYGALLVQTDLFTKNNRRFNKGAAINAGFQYWQYRGWRLHLDADIVLPDNMRRVMFNHQHLDKDAIYGADRVNVIGRRAIHDIRLYGTQYRHSFLVESNEQSPIGGRYVDMLNGYVPLGYFQMWYHRTQKPYPYSEGTAAHDDIMFGALWPREKRLLLPSAVVYHLCQRPPVWSENWEGHRRHPRLK